MSRYDNPDGRAHSARGGAASPFRRLAEPRGAACCGGMYTVSLPDGTLLYVGMSGRGLRARCRRPEAARGGTARLLARKPQRAVTSPALSAPAGFYNVDASFSLPRVA